MRKYSLEFTNVRDLMRKAKAIEQAHIEQANKNEKLLIEKEFPYQRLPYGFSMDINDLTAEQLELILGGLDRSIIEQSFEDNGVKIIEEESKPKP